jgi:hypothetical protein
MLDLIKGNMECMWSNSHYQSCYLSVFQTKVLVLIMKIKDKHFITNSPAIWLITLQNFMVFTFQFVLSSHLCLHIFLVSFVRHLCWKKYTNHVCVFLLLRIIRVKNKSIKLSRCIWVRDKSSHKILGIHFFFLFTNSENKNILVYSSSSGVSFYHNSISLVC